MKQVPYLSDIFLDRYRPVYPEQFHYPYNEAESPFPFLHKRSWDPTQVPNRDLHCGYQTTTKCTVGDRSS